MRTIAFSTAFALFAFAGLAAIYGFATGSLAV